MDNNHDLGLHPCIKISPWYDMILKLCHLLPSNHHTNNHKLLMAYFWNSTRQSPLMPTLRFLANMTYSHDLPYYPLSSCKKLETKNLISSKRQKNNFLHLISLNLLMVTLSPGLLFPNISRHTYMMPLIDLYHHEKIKNFEWLISQKIAKIPVLETKYSLIPRLEYFSEIKVILRWCFL